MDRTLVELIEGRLVEERARESAPPEAVPVPPLPTRRYTDPEFFALEQERIFRRQWLFAGHSSEWDEPGAFRRFTRTTSPLVIVRGEDGALRAFHDVCRHRGAPVTDADCGTARRLRCGYHSWTYRLDGTLAAVPDSRNFVDLPVADLGLEPARCEEWEGWVFVSEDPAARPLVEHLGPLAQQMVALDGPSMRAVGTQHHLLECNWKLVVDAFGEVYHIRSVHPDNAALLYDDRSIVLAMLAGGHSRLTVDKREELRDFPMVPPELENPSVPDLWRRTSTSFGIFPNVVLPADTGAFTFLCAWPLGVDRTELELRWYAPAWGTDEVPVAHLERLALFETVMAQDTANLAPIQRSVSSPGIDHFTLGWHERLVHHFHRSVDLAIGADLLPPGTAVSDALDPFVES